MIDDDDDGGVPMYRMNQWRDGYELYELVDDSTNSWFRIAPERGGLVVSLGLAGEELLYLDKDTFLNPDTNVRGGIPVLFPICGQLQGGAYEWQGTTYFMKNHGVARTNPWTVLNVDTKDGAAITLQLVSNERTLAEFPFEFELVFEYVLKGGSLTIFQTYINKSNRPMPMYAGFHPYFKSSVKDLHYDTDATRYLDYNDMAEKDYEGHIDLTNMVESAVLLNASRRSISFPLPDIGRKVLMEYGPEFKYVVLWTVSGKPFVCVEPWMAKTGSLNTGQDVMYVKPGVPLKTYLTIRCM
jgi:galactose mutarotase-like enzyme